MKNPNLKITEFYLPGTVQYSAVGKTCQVSLERNCLVLLNRSINTKRILIYGM